MTGSLNKQINVSISEKEKLTNANNLNKKLEENSHRYIGYTVARGDGQYNPTKEDAKYLHYVNRLSTYRNAAGYNDHTSVGVWDYMLNPEKNTIILGQRAKMVYHVNAPDAKFADNSKEKEELFDVYDSYKVKVNKISDEPTREGYVFKGWFTVDAQGNVVEMASEDTEKDKLVDFDKISFGEMGREITTILNPNEVHVYAGWIKESELKKSETGPELSYDLPKLEIGKAVLPPLEYDLPKLEIGRPTEPPNGLRFAKIRNRATNGATTRL